MVPKLWSQGQLFAFSALDGPTCFEDDLSGILCGEKLGIRFFTEVRRELVITGIRGFVPEFEAVTGDLIAATTPEGSMHILFAQAHLIVGNTAAGTQPVMITEGAYQQIVADGILIHDTGDGDLTDNNYAPSAAGMPGEPNPYTLSDAHLAMLKQAAMTAYAANTPKDPEPETLRGDVNGDGTVSDQDAMYLLRFTLFGETRYPLH